MAQIPTPGWVQVPGTLAQVSVASQSVVYGVNPGGVVYCFQGGSGDWETVPGPSGGLSNISAAADGTVWGVSSANLIYRFDPGAGTWVSVIGALVNVSAGSATNVWGVNATGAIYKYVGGSQVWANIPGSLANISAAADGTVWGVNAAHDIFRYVGGAKVWENVPGKLTNIYVGSRNAIWGVDPASNVFQFVGGSAIWQQMPGALAQVSVASDGSVWGVQAGGTILCYARSFPVVIGNGRLAHGQLKATDRSEYLFDLINPSTNVVVRNLRLFPCFDPNQSSGVTITPPVAVIGSLEPQQIIQNLSFGITSSNAQVKSYRMGMTATFDVTFTTSAIPIQGPGGTLTFSVVAN